MDRLLLTKYEGLGNDFLISFDATGSATVPPRLAAALCDRTRGVGADGLIQLRPTGGATAFHLTNADGSPAEVSGNGLRCAALAMFDAGMGSSAVDFVTVGGMRRAALVAGGDGEASIRVELGQVSVRPVDSPDPKRSAYRVEVGNPHLVLIGEQLDDVDLALVGPPLERARPGGQNVEFVAVRSRAELSMIVFERGAGITEACGSGSVASAAAALAAGVTDASVTVHNPGGPLGVELDEGPGGQLQSWLTGPARRIAEIEVRLGDFGRFLGEGATTPR